MSLYTNISFNYKKPHIFQKKSKFIELFMNKKISNVFIPMKKKQSFYFYIVIYSNKPTSPIYLAVFIYLYTHPCIYIRISFVGFLKPKLTYYRLCGVEYIHSYKYIIYGFLAQLNERFKRSINLFGFILRRQVK